MRSPKIRLLALLLVVSMSGLSACVTIGAQAGGSSNSSADSSNSSAQSGEGSAASGRSSEQSGQSSNTSSQSSDNSSQNSSGESSANSSQGGNGQSTLIVSGSGTLLVTVGGIAATIFGIKASADRRAKRAQVALMYLRANSDQLKQDLAFGAGPTLDDLAGSAQIRSEHRGRFAEVMQRNRRDLLSLSHVGQLTAERALQFLEKVGTLVRADPLLRDDYERWASELDG